MARGRALKTKDATVVILQRGDENFWSFEEESEHIKCNGFIVKDVGKYEQAHFANPSTSYYNSSPPLDVEYYDSIDSPLPSTSKLPSLSPEKAKRKPRKRKNSSQCVDDESGFNSESSEDGDEIEGIADFYMPSIPPEISNKKPLSSDKCLSSNVTSNIDEQIARSQPFTMSEYMRRSTFMRFTANERRLLERTFRGYLISQLDTKIDHSEGIALNGEDIQERLNLFERHPILDCLACEKAGKPATESPPLFRDGRKETRPHIRHAAVIGDPLGVRVNFQNPLFRKGVARLPDLRLIGHNANKLAPVVASKVKRNARTPVAVHLCDQYYGGYEYATRNAFSSPFSKIIRPLIICRTLYSMDSFKHQANVLQKRIDMYNFANVRRGRSKSEPPPYSKVASVSPFGAFRVRTSRSVSPNRRRHPEMELEPTAIRSPYECCGEMLNRWKGIKKPLATQKYMLCTKSNGTYSTFFTFEKSENSILMPTRPSTNGSCRFRRLFFENEINAFNVFEFTVIENEMFEYFAKLRFTNADNPCIELRPETKFGAVLPKRIIFSYLRICRKIPKPIQWQKPQKKQKTTMLGSEASSGYGSGTCSTRSSVVEGNAYIVISIVDVLKWIGFYCVTPDEPKARYCLMGAFGRDFYPPSRAVTLLELAQLSFDNGGLFCQESSLDWKKKVESIRQFVSGKKNLRRPHAELFQIKAFPVPNKRKPENVASLFCYKLEKPLKQFEIYALNETLEKNYYYLLSVRYTLYSEPDSAEFDTDTDEDFEWDTNATIYNLGDPKPLYSHEYSLGDFTMTKVKNSKNKDLSNVIPRSRYLRDKIEAGTGKPPPKRYRTPKALRIRPRWNRHWDDSSEDDDVQILEEDSVISISVKPQPLDYEYNDFDDMIPVDSENIRTVKEDNFVFPTYIPEGEKEIEEGDMAVILASGAPLPLSGDEQPAVASKMMEPSALKESMAAIKELSPLVTADIDSKLINPLEESHVNHEILSESMAPIIQEMKPIRKVRFKLSPICNNKSVKKVSMKSCLKKKATAIRKLTTSSPSKMLSDDQLPSPDPLALLEFEIQCETELKKSNQRRQELVDKLETELSKPLNVRMQEIQETIRKEFNLPNEGFLERNGNFKWRPVAADIDQEQFASLLNHMDWNCFWYWNGWLHLQNSKHRIELLSNHDQLRHYRKIETFKAIQEARPFNPRRRRRSLDPVQLRFSYHVILNDEYNDNTEKTPFEHFYELEFPSPTTTTTPKHTLNPFRRSISLPRLFFL